MLLAAQHVWKNISASQPKTAEVCKLEIIPFIFLQIIIFQKSLLSDKRSETANNKQLMGEALWDS